MIEKLKKNWKPWYALDQEEQNTFRLVKKKNCVFHRATTSDWARCNNTSWNTSYVYRIIKDYGKEPITQPQFVYFEKDKLWFDFCGERYALSEAVDFVDFLYYEYKDGKRSNCPRRIINSSSTETPKTDWPKWVVFKR